MSEHTVIRWVAWLVGRPEWGRAMLAEVEQLSTPRARRRFARGCVRALVQSVPAVVGGLLVAGLLSIAVVVAALVRYPGLVTGSGTWVAIGLFVIVVIGYLAIGAGLASRVARATSTWAVGVGTAVALSWMATGFAAAPSGVRTTLLVLAADAVLVLGWRSTRRWSSWAVGVQGVALAGIAAGLVLFLLWAGETMLFAGRPYEAGMVRDFRASTAPDLATYAVSDSLGAGMMLLLLVPLVSLAAGACGAVVASRRPWSVRTDG